MVSDSFLIMHWRLIAAMSSTARPGGSTGKCCNPYPCRLRSAFQFNIRPYIPITLEYIRSCVRLIFHQVGHCIAREERNKGSVELSAHSPTCPTSRF